MVLRYLIWNDTIKELVKPDQINAAIERARKVISLAADKAEIDPKHPNITRMPEEWSLVMHVAYDVLGLAESLKRETEIKTWQP